MDALSRDAAELAIGFRLGLASQAEVVSWADETIASLSDPPLTLIDLAMMSNAHAHNVLSKLSELSSGLLPVQVLPQALGRYANCLRKSPQAGPAAAKGLWGIYIQSRCDVPRELSPIAA